MKKTKRGIEISHWKVQGTDAFAAITPGCTDDELDTGPNDDDIFDTEQNYIDTQTQNLVYDEVTMGNELNPKETATFEEVLISNVFTQEAIINVLERKGLLSRAEVMQEIIELKKKQAKGK